MITFSSLYRRCSVCGGRLTIIYFMFIYSIGKIYVMYDSNDYIFIIIK